MSMYTLLRNRNSPTEEEVERACTGEHNTQIVRYLLKVLIIDGCKGKCQVKWLLGRVNAVLLLTLGAHAQRGLRYLPGVFVCVLRVSSSSCYTACS